MHIHVVEKQKNVEVFLTKAEQNDPAITERLKEIYAKYKNTKYTVCVYHSGDGDLYENTRELLTYNKRRIVELEKQKRREQQMQEPVLEEMPKPEHERTSILERLRAPLAPPRAVNPAVKAKRAELEL